MSFRHLTYDDRLKIEKMTKALYTPLQIASTLDIHVSTVYRELRRGRFIAKDRIFYDDVVRYSADIAQHDYDHKATSKGAVIKLGKHFDMAAEIERLILSGWSPAAVAAVLRRGEISLCEATIYRYIDKGFFLHISNKDLPEKSRRKKRPYKRIRTNRLVYGTTIEKRPDNINERQNFGHWEMDLVIGRASDAVSLLVLTERLTRFELIYKLPDKKAQSVSRVIDSIHRRNKDFGKLFKSITVDNGPEFRMSQRIEYDSKGLRRTQLFFCHPYSSWERGSNEIQNRFIRRFIPKKTSITNIKQTRIKEIQNFINNYPREILTWKCAQELFDEQCAIHNISFIYQFSQ